MHKPILVVGVLAIVAGGAILAAGLTHVGEKPAKLTWRDPEIKPALMTLGYKVYANPKVEFGRHYLSKLVFKNTGEHPVTDFSISYKIDDYIPWTDPEEIHEVPAGFTLVRLFYPKLPPSVTKIRNATNATFRARARWKEEGRVREETFAREIVLRGINELVSSDLPDSESRNWFDQENAAAFAVCMVTPNDPAVTLYASEITRLAGGTTAGILGGTKEIGRLCEIVYDYMKATELRYTGANFVIESLSGVTTGVQTVRMPRDAIQTNQALCIELSILWASVLQHLGVDSTMVFVPGHVFIIAYSEKLGLPFERGLPIECTAITTRAVEHALVHYKIRERATGEPVTFKEAIEMAMSEWDDAQKSGQFILVPVRPLQAQGYVAPEMADLDMDKLTETLRKRLPQQVEQAQVREETQNRDGQRQPGATQPAGARTWTHPRGYVSVSLPPDFVSVLPSPSPFPFLVMSMGNPATMMGCDVMEITGTSDPMQAVNYVAQSYGAYGLQVQVTSSGAAPNGIVACEGFTNSQAGSSRWTCIGKPIPGGVVLVSVGAPYEVWTTQGQILQGIINSVRFN
jgi:hypothetical protein